MLREQEFGLKVHKLLAMCSKPERVSVADWPSTIKSKIAVKAHIILFERLSTGGSPNCVRLRVMDVMNSYNLTWIGLEKKPDMKFLENCLIS